MKVPGRRFLAHCVLLSPAIMILAFGADRLAGRVADLRSLAADYAACRSRGRQLDVRLESAHRRVLATQEVLAVLARGGMTLREAGARFSGMNSERPPCLQEQFRQLYPGNTEEERQCRLIVAYAREMSNTSPALAAALPRLERELRELYGTDARERGEFLGSQGED